MREFDSHPRLHSFQALTGSAEKLSQPPDAGRDRPLARRLLARLLPDQLLSFLTAKAALIASAAASALCGERWT